MTQGADVLSDVFTNALNILPPEPFFVLTELRVMFAIKCEAAIEKTDLK